MNLPLTAEQAAAQAGFREFVDREVVPTADENHRAQRTPPQLIQRLVEQGFLGLTVPSEFGGAGRDMITLGLLAEELGRGCSSLRSLLTVHTMVAQSILRWGSRDQKAQWLPRLASGQLLGALALSEPNIGSDAGGIETIATPTPTGYVVRGTKKWTTYGQIADLFLVFARCEGKPLALLVEKNSPGLSTEPLLDLLGTRASMVATVHLQDCVVPKENLLGRVGLGISHIANSALDSGRYTVAWGCVGIAQACLEASIVYSSERRQFGVLLKDHQLIRRMVTDMLTGVTAARLLCLQAGRLKDAKDPESLAATSMAKYFAADLAMKSSTSAVQLHGANGCSREYPVQRFFGDAKIMEIIEGSTEIHQSTLADYGYQEYGALLERAGRAATGGRS